MKKKLLAAFCALALTMVGALPVFAASGNTNPGAGVVGSPHDMNLVAPGTDVYDDGSGNTGRVCAYCHTPHHAMEDSLIADYNPLWSHQVSQATFEAYNSTTLDATISDPVIGPSRLCMSCHDGVVAIDQHYGSAGTVVRADGDSWGDIDVGDVNGGSSLTNDHPVGFSYTAVYEAEAANGNLKAPGIRPTTADVKRNDGTDTGLDVGDLMWVNPNDGEKYMTCASCHDVHNKDNVENYFLYNDQEKSAICLTCHDK